MVETFITMNEIDKKQLFNKFQNRTYLSSKPSIKLSVGNFAIPIIPASPKSGNVINLFLFPGTTTITPIYFGKKRYELTDWLGNVRVVINDRKTPVNSGTTTVSYFPQVVSVSDYYSFGSQISERSYEPVKPLYRFGFNTQEKVNEISPDHYTAKYWEYDARLGRRWNVDPKNHASYSPFIAFADNPVWFADPLGDTTYIYNTSGVFKGVIYDKLSSNEIVVMKDEWISIIMKLRGKYSDDIVAKVSRDPKFAYARFTSNSINQLLHYRTNEKAENSGLIYADPNTKEVQVAICKECKKSEKEINALGEAEGRYLMNLEEKIEKLGNIIGVWHTHPEDSYEGLQPTSTPDDYLLDYKVNERVNALRNGGLGIIVNKKNINIYPLYNFKKGGMPEKGIGYIKGISPSEGNPKPIFNINISPQYVPKSKGSEKSRSRID